MRVLLDGEHAQFGAAAVPGRALAGVSIGRIGAARGAACAPTPALTIRGRWQVSTAGGFIAALAPRMGASCSSSTAPGWRRCRCRSGPAFTVGGGAPAVRRDALRHAPGLRLRRLTGRAPVPVRAGPACCAPRPARLDCRGPATGPARSPGGWPKNASAASISVAIARDRRVCRPRSSSSVQSNEAIASVASNTGSATAVRLAS